MQARVKHCEITDWMKKNQCDVCAINETGLNGDEYVEVDDGFKWFGSNRPYEKGRSGGAGFIVRNTIDVCELPRRCEDVCFVKIGKKSGKMEWLLGSVYMSCEGTDMAGNKNKLNFITEVVQNARAEGLKIMVGGDMNGHVWEIDGIENGNGRLMKCMTKDAGLQILNLRWDGMNKPTWYLNDKQYTLDYVCTDDIGLNRIKNACIMECEDVVESDHCAVMVCIHWKIMKETRMKRMKTEGKKRVRMKDWSRYGERMNGAHFENLTDMEVKLVKVATTMHEEETVWKENRNVWFTDDIKELIEQRKAANRERRAMTKRYSLDDERVKDATDVYMKKKLDASHAVEVALQAHNVEVMKEISKNGTKKDIFGHLKKLMYKGKERKDESALVIRKESGEVVKEEDGIVAEIECFWKTLFSMNGNARLGVAKERVAGGMEEGKDFSMQELMGAVKKMKMNKAVDESGVIAEFVKALTEESMKELRRLLVDVQNGSSVPEEWKMSRVVLIHKGGSVEDLKNYRPIAIINVICKLCMMIVKERISAWVEDTNMLGDVQCGFRKDRRTEDNLYMMERMIEMARSRKEEMYIAFIDMEKAYDRVDRRKLFEIIRMYGIDERLVSLIERVYEDNRVKFELGRHKTEWCNSESGLRQGCPLSPLLFNIYVSELGECISKCEHGFKYRVVSESGSTRMASQAGFMYADDICLIASSVVLLQEVFNSVSDCIDEYGLKVSEKKTKVVCVNGPVEKRKWRCGDILIDETDQYKYLGVTVDGGTNGGFRSMGDRMKEANKVLGMVKFAAGRSGSRYVIGREGWKSVVVSKLMYGCGALAWYQHECNDLEVIQNEMGRWLWSVTNVRNELVRGETGWSTFEEREVKALMDCFLRIIFKKNIVSEIGLSCLIEVGGRSRWWARVSHLCSKYKLEEFVDLLWLCNVGVSGMHGLRCLGMDMRESYWRKEVRLRIEASGREVWRNGFSDRTREREYVIMKGKPRNEGYANGSTGAMVRMMIRGGCLQVRSNVNMGWKYDGDDKCSCGMVETERHMMMECERYDNVRVAWLRTWRDSMGDIDPMEGLKGYTTLDNNLEKKTLSYLATVWNIRSMDEKARCVNGRL